VLSAERQINNGQPSLHARCIAALKPQAGEVVVHVGAGGGYYSAVLAELVGPDGRVHAYEVERDLAERAAQAMAERANVTVHAGSVFDEPLPRCDVLYASAGATHPPAPWLDALRPRGRMLFPMTRDDGSGAMLLIERAADGGPRDAARFLVQVQFIDCTGARDPVQARRLERAFARGDGGKVRSLRRDMPPDDSAWCVGAGWWLSTDPP
jgi:protein-L-isoaspartate(D-aspartate) O-methyltransferase